MTVSLSVVSTGGAATNIASGTGSVTRALTLTTGRGAIFIVFFGQGTVAPATSSATLTTDALTQIGADRNRAGDTNTNIAIFYCPEITVASQTFTWNFSGGNNTGSANVTVLDATGHNVASMIGASNVTDAASPVTATITTGFDNSAIICALTGGFVDPVSVTGYTSVDSDNSQRRNNLVYKNDVGSAGAKSLATDGGDFAFAIEIKTTGGGTAKDLTGSATAGASGTGALSITKQLAAAAVAGALGSGALSVSRALTGSAIGQALGSATLSAFSNVWRVPTNAPNGTAVHVIILNGSSPNYAVVAQGPATVAGGYADLPATGAPGTKAFGFVHNYNDNTATTSIRGGPSIATLTAI